MIYQVFYIDDFNKKHITFVKSFKDVKFIQERYEMISVEMINANFIPKNGSMV